MVDLVSGRASASLDLVLHAWDPDGNEKMMMNGKTGDKTASI